MAVERADPPEVGQPMEVVFAGLEPKAKYRVHLLLPSGQSVYRQATATDAGRITFRHEAVSDALHVVELHSGFHDERVVEAVAHVRPLPKPETE